MTRTYHKPLVWDGGQWLPNPALPGAAKIDPGVVSTTTTLSGPASANAGTNITLTATVKSGATPVTTGNVQFKSGSTVLATVALNGSGQAAHTRALAATTAFSAVYVPASGYLGSTSGTVTVTAKTKKTATKVLACSWSACYQGDGDKRTVSELYQGYYSSTNGNQRSLAGFGALGLPSGSTVTKVEVYLYAAHWGDSGGGTAAIGDATYTSAPASYTSGGNKDVVRQAWSSKTGGKWITLSSAQAARFAAGTARCIVIGPGPTTNTLAYYGYFNGNGQSNEPQLRVTYEYWS